MPLRIGAHPSNLHLTLAQHWPGAFSALDAQFVSYAEGRDTGRQLAEDQIDVGGTGSTPPILSQVAGLDVLYVAASAPRPANGGILVAKRSSINSVKDLAGKKIALLDGSFHTYLLARVLEDEGLSLKDVVRVERAPVPSRDALIAGKVDAWVAMAPLLGQRRACWCHAARPFPIDPSFGRWAGASLRPRQSTPSWRNSAASAPRSPPTPIAPRTSWPASNSAASTLPLGARL